MSTSFNPHKVSFANESLDNLNDLFRHESFPSVVEFGEQKYSGFRQILVNARDALTLLVARCTTNSGNSSMPPSADDNASAIREKNKEQAQKLKPLKEKRKPGGQPGHKGTTLKITDKPDKVEPVYPKNLPEGGDYVFEVMTSYQDVDIEIRRTVVQYDYYKATDRNTGKVYEPEILGRHLTPNAREIRVDFSVVGQEESSPEASHENEPGDEPEDGSETGSESSPKEQTETCLKRRRKPRSRKQRGKRRRMRRRRAQGYGPGAKAMAVSLCLDNFLPSRRTTTFLAGLGINVSEGSIYNWIVEGSLRLQGLGFQVLLYRGLMSATVLNLDETYMKFDKKRTYIHTWTDEHWTLYHFSLNRGLLAHEEVCIHDLATGSLTPLLKCCTGSTMVHDAWSSYFRYEDNEHALCHAHVERELNKFAEMKFWRWPQKFIDFFRDLYKAVEDAGGAVTEEGFKKRWLRRYKRLLTNAFNEMGEDESRKDVPGQVFQRADALRRRLEDRWREYLIWAIKKDVPYTNNLAERRLRMLKVRDKVSNCFRNLEFAMDWCLVRSYIQTAKNLGCVDAREALESLFSGQLHECITKAAANLPALPANWEVLYAG